MARIKLKEKRKCLFYVKKQCVMKEKCSLFRNNHGCTTKGWIDNDLDVDNIRVDNVNIGY